MPDFDFSWDECSIFHVESKRFDLMADVIEQWVCAKKMPSEMARQFPWIEMFEVAKYYEEGHGLEGEFITSWKWLEQDFERWGMPQVAKFMADLRSRGYDKLLRAGQSVRIWLILSRSRRHGMTDEQPFVSFAFWDDGKQMEVHAKIDDERTFHCPRVEVTDEIERVLSQLIAKEIT